MDGRQNTRPSGVHISVRSLCTALISFAFLAAGLGTVIYLSVGYHTIPNDLMLYYYLGILVTVISLVPLGISSVRLFWQISAGISDQQIEKRRRVLYTIIMFAAPAVLILQQILTSGSFWLYPAALVALLFAAGARDRGARRVETVLCITVAVSLIICLTAGIRLIHFSRFRSIDLENADPNAGSNVVCYNTDTRRFDHEFTPDGRRAKSAADTGYVVMYTLGQHTREYNYTSHQSGRTAVAVTSDTVKLSLFDIKAGKIVKTGEYIAPPPSSVADGMTVASAAYDSNSILAMVSEFLPGPTGS